MEAPVPITYTFGNHMHWADMEWLWGYHVLPGSVRDMLRFCRETGAKGNVNFDGIGYEKLAAENPEAFAELKAAVRDGIIEIVGGSYGQPYGLFHGGESNVRQRVYGVRAVRRLFGVEPVTFWEEEFDFFPQLPQILAGCGFRYASLFFQWTWHTPELPIETVPVVQWEAPDGSRLTAATRNRLNLHQWPEDVQVLMDELAQTGGATGDLILQWLELMPSPDWMCRSEVLLPKTHELLGDPRFDVRFATLGEYLKDRAHSAPVRRYTMDDVWHGMSLGKNGDRHPRTSHQVERQLQLAEFLYALVGRFGRPYPQWDVYPVWELEEGWRNLLAAQHHDNHECEGLCGRVGYAQFEMARTLANPDQAEDLLAKRAIPAEGGALVVNPFGWARTVPVDVEGREAVVEVPAFGYRVVSEPELTGKRRTWKREGSRFAYRAVGFAAVLDPATWTLDLTVGGRSRTLAMPVVEWSAHGRRFHVGRLSSPPEIDGETLTLCLEPDCEVLMWLSVPATHEALDITVSFEPTDAFAPCDPGIEAGAHVVWTLSGDLWVDQPYGISQVRPNSSRPRKYPRGDWMTSPQWFETIPNPFESMSLVDVVSPDGSGVLLVHDGSQQWLKEDEKLRCVLTMRDPWDEDRYEADARATFRIALHGGLSNAERYRRSREQYGSAASHYLVEPRLHGPDPERTPDMPRAFSLVACDAPGVAVTALYRETGFATPDGGRIDYPYVLRLVEFDGTAVEANLSCGATVAAAFKTDHLGEAAAPLTVVDGRVVSVSLRPYEIATLYVDFVEGRKQTRDLDAKREIWATVHRV